MLRATFFPFTYFLYWHWGFNTITLRLVSVCLSGPGLLNLLSGVAAVAKFCLHVGKIKFNTQNEKWICIRTYVLFFTSSSSSSSIGTTTPCCVLACSTIVEPSQQEGFYRVLLPAARQIPNLEDQWLELSNFCHKVPPASETTRASPSRGRWKCGREMADNFAESGDFHVTFRGEVN